MYFNVINKVPRKEIQQSAYFPVAVLGDVAAQLLSQRLNTLSAEQNTERVAATALLE